MVSTEAIAAMKLMAADPKKRAVLVKDSTCVGGLVLVLSNPDPAIVQVSLETLNLLCESSEAPKILRNYMGMQDQLEDIILTSEEKDSVLKGLAESLRNKLRESKAKDTTQVPLRDSSNTSRRSTSSRNSSVSGQPKAKSIVLQLRGLHDKSDRDLCARLLLKTRGVVSITFDLTKKRCILRTKLDVKPEALAATVARSMTMTAQQVIKNENGDESYVNFNTSGHLSPPCAEKENTDLPDYLSDDSDVTFTEEKALKKPTKEDEQKSANWFSVAANFLTNSFYW